MKVYDLVVLFRFFFFFFFCSLVLQCSVCMKNVNVYICVRLFCLVGFFFFFFLLPCLVE